MNELTKKKNVQVSSPQIKIIKRRTMRKPAGAEDPPLWWGNLSTVSTLLGSFIRQHLLNKR